MNRVLIVTLILTLLSGCSFLTGIDSKYPDHWPEVVAQEDLCEKITGTYENKGSATYSPRGGSPFLTYRFGMHSPPEDEQLSITIECTDREKLIVIATVSDANVITKKIALDKDGWHLEKDALYFPTIKESGADGLGGFISKTEFRLAIGINGNLIGEERSGGVGLALWLIPIGGTQTFWFQWPQLAVE